MTISKECSELGWRILNVYSLAEKARILAYHPDTEPIALDYILSLKTAAFYARPALGKTATEEIKSEAEAAWSAANSGDWGKAMKVLGLLRDKMEEALYQKVVACECKGWEARAW